MKKGTEKESWPVEELFRYALVIQFYAQYLSNQRNKNKTLLTGWTDVVWNADYTDFATTLRRLLERKYNELIKEFEKMANEGATNLIAPVMAGLGSKAFDQPWFTEGLKIIHRKGKAIAIPKLHNGKVSYLGKKIMFRDFLDKMLKFERRMQKESLNGALSYYVSKQSGAKSLYYRFPKKQAKSFYYFFLHNLLHAEGQAMDSLLKGIPHLKDLDKAKKKVEKYFPK